MGLFDMFMLGLLVYFARGEGYLADHGSKGIDILLRGCALASNIISLGLPDVPSQRTPNH